ncbi:MAG: hypothetical protein J0J15_23660 [Mesorhizobium sp.]|nr:hypothetical protein [Mesorhizobium sp.]
MKTILAALMFAVAMPAATLPATAASMTYSTDNGDMVIRRDHRRHDDRAEWRHHRDDRNWRRHHRRDCCTRVVKTWRHHRPVVREITVCN